EGWVDKSGSKWKTMPQQMLQYRAASFLVRAFAPELSMGLQTADELQDVGELRTVTVTQASRAPEMLQQIEQELTGSAATGDEPQRVATGPDISAQEIHDAISNATDKDALDAAVDLISLLPESERKPLYDLGTVAAGKF